jgi:hypothetical protein
MRTTFLAMALAAAVAAPAGAAPQPVYPEMHFEPVEVIRDSRGRITAYQLCAAGDATFLYVFGAWDYRVDGTRSGTAGAVGPAITERHGDSGDPQYRHCHTVARLGYANGSAHATFSYNGVGGNAPYTIERTFAWCEGCPAPELLNLAEGVDVEVDPL